MSQIVEASKLGGLSTQPWGSPPLTPECQSCDPQLGFERKGGVKLQRVVPKPVFQVFQLALCRTLYYVNGEPNSKISRGHIFI